MARSIVRFASVFGAAVVLSQALQVAWLIVGSRVTSLSDFGVILTAQAIYGLAQYALDNGTAFHGARLAAAGALDEAARRSVVRVRLELAGLAAMGSLGVGAAGGSDLLVATLPFAAALVLFAAFGYWERFGLGDSSPWAVYLVLRAGAPFLAACAFLVAGRDLPVVVPGVAECLAILAVALAFRLEPGSEFLRGLRGDGGGRRAALGVGLPNLVWQAGLFAGIVLLGAWGAAAAAAALAVGVRLLTGVNQVAGVLATSLYPSLAARRGSEPGLDGRLVGLALGGVFAVVLAANAVVLAVPDAVVELLLGERSADAVTTAVLVLSGSGAVVLSLLLTMALVARRAESRALPAHLAGTAVALAAGLVVVLWSRDPVAMAGALVAGQLVGVSALTAAARPLAPALQRRFVAAAGTAWVLALIGAAAAAVADARPLLAGLVGVACLALVAALAARVRAAREAS